MTRFGKLLGPVTVALGAFVLMTAAMGCDEDGKTAPERCAQPPLEIFDIQKAAPPAEGGEAALNPCVTPIGHAISSIDTGDAGGTSATGGTTAGTGGGGTTSTGGTSGGGGTPDAGAGGN
jgi:uncharacterized membrane protein YgcG